MSTILKALRRLEDETTASDLNLRESVVLRGHPERERAPEPGRPHRWLWIGLPAVLVIAAGLLWIAPWSDSETIATSAPAPSDATPAAPATSSRAAPQSAQQPQPPARPSSEDPRSFARERMEAVRARLAAAQAGAPPRPRSTRRTGEARGGTRAPAPARPSYTRVPAAARYVAPPPQVVERSITPPAQQVVSRSGASPGPPAADPVAAEAAAPASPDAALASEPTEAVVVERPRPARASAPSVVVTGTVWHPAADRRVAILEVDGEPDLRLHEGDTVGSLTVLEVGPSSVVFDSDGAELRRRVGER